MNSLRPQGCYEKVETAAIRSLPPWWHHQRLPHTPLPSKSFLRGRICCSDKLRAVPVWPYLHLTQHEPAPLRACATQSIYFLGKKRGSHGVILSSHFPPSIAFRGDFQMVLEKKKALNTCLSCPVRLVAMCVGELRAKMGFVAHVKKQVGRIQQAEQKGLILLTWVGCQGAGNWTCYCNVDSGFI